MAAEGQLLSKKVIFWSLFGPGLESDIYDCFV